MTLVYNVYLYPLTANSDRLGRWRGWIANQNFYAGNHGMGVRYQHPFRCNHCKTVDHPSGLCPHMRTGRERGEGARGGNPPRPDDDDEFLPMKKDSGPPGPKPKPPTPGPSRGKGVDKGKGKAPGPQGQQKAKGGSARNRTAPGVEVKKRRME